jgi:hypothetical protein
MSGTGPAPMSGGAATRSRAVCVRCAGERERWDQVCPGCGHRPDEEGRLVAWLLSSENLSAEELTALRERIAGGEVVRPSGRTLDKARRALGRHFSTDSGLSFGERVGMLAVNLLLTPLVGWVCFAWWWNARPRASMQALALSLPATVAFTLLVLYLR